MTGIKGVLRGALVAVLAWPPAVTAKSTFSARFSVDVVAGPGIEQTLPLYVHYFPGDGEAVLRVRFDVEAAAATLLAATSSLGKVESLTPSFIIDYDERPIGGEKVDTVMVSLSSRNGEEMIWRGAIHTTDQPEGVPAHAGQAVLGVTQPLEVHVELEEKRLFPGQETAVAVVVSNVDRGDRGLTSIEWDWPSGLEIDGNLLKRWSPPLAPGATDTLTWQVRLDEGVSSGPAVTGRAGGIGVTGSPVGPLAFEPAALPRLGTKMEVAFMELGKPGEVEFIWRNDSSKSLSLNRLELQIPDAFTDVHIVDGPAGVEFVADDSGRRIVLPDVESMKPEGSLSLRLRGRPTLPGRFTWPSTVVPVDHFWEVSLPTPAVVPVALPAGDSGSTADVRGYATDLEVLGMALGASLDKQLTSLSVPFGTVLHLRPDDKEEQNWIVEDALTRALMSRGYDISLVEPDAEEGGENSTAVGVLTYRLVDSRVVYSPQRGKLLRVTSTKTREAFGDLFLSLELAGNVVWANRVPAYVRDEVPGGKMDVLGGSDLIERTVVQADNKLLSRVLSVSILGGLLYIFVVP